MRKIISRGAVLAGFLLAFSGCHLIHKSQAASEDSKGPSNRAVANIQSECNADNYLDFIYTPGVHNCDLREVDFREKDLSGANFKGADCREADFRGAILIGADFSDADCSYAKFQNVEAFRNSKWSYTILIRTIMPGRLWRHVLRSSKRSKESVILYSGDLQERRNEQEKRENKSMRERLEEGEEGLEI